MIIRLAKCSVQCYRLYAYPAVSSLGVFHHAGQNWCRKLLVIHSARRQIQWKHFQCFCMKSRPRFPRCNFSILRISPPSLMGSPRTPTPISPRSALLSACPLVMAVPRYNGSPPYLTHSYANIRFRPNIWWQDFLSLFPSPLIMQW